jgi:hypothetical protein
MKIAIIGALGTVKEALAYRMAANAELNARRCCVLDDVAQKTYASYGEITVDTAYYLVCQQIFLELEQRAYEYSDIICLSSAIDPILYLNLRKPKEGYEEIRRLAERWMQTYTLILYVKTPEHEIALTDEFHMFQEQVDEQFDLYLQNIFKDYLKTNIYKIESDDILTQPTVVLLNKIAENEDWIREFF